VPFKVFMDPPDDDGNIGVIAKACGIKAVPETALIDRKGNAVLVSELGRISIDTQLIIERSTSRTICRTHRQHHRARARTGSTLTILAPWGGSVDAASEEGQGCAFELRLVTVPA
jgi:hypothetical protein